jgi:hypothetical protein
MDITAMHRQITRLEQLLVAQGSRSQLNSGDIEFQDAILFENDDLKAQNAMLKADLEDAQRKLSQNCQIENIETVRAERTASEL